MSSPCTTFRGLLRYEVTDRDGYPDELYTVVSLLRCYADGTLDCIESDGMPADVDACEPGLRGSWTAADDGTLALLLERVRPPAQVDLEAPNGGRDHHAYPASGKLDSRLEGTHRAVCVGHRLFLLDADRDVVAWHHERLGEHHPELPRLPGEPLDPANPWVTFHRDGGAIDVQHTPEDEPREVSRHVHLRLHPDGRVETCNSRRPPAHEFQSFVRPSQTGSWHLHEASGQLRFTLARANPDEPQWLQVLTDGSYDADHVGVLECRAHGDDKIYVLERCSGEVDWLPTGAGPWIPPPLPE